MTLPLTCARATLRRIDALSLIPDADIIFAARIDSFLPIAQRAVGKTFCRCEKDDV